MSGQKILSISNDKSLLEIRRMILELHGFDVTSALGYNDSLATCRQSQNFDLVIMGDSIHRPEKEQLLAEVKKNGSAKVLYIRTPGDRPLLGAENSIETLDSPEALIQTVNLALR